ncbi:MAG: nucleotidyltransferase domain-containing protein [Nitrospirae bacterium]|nr:nucleotidyltransferase domain-containing protein [Nitrospirota bacterium]
MKSAEGREVGQIIGDETIARELEAFCGLLEREWGEELVSIVLFGSWARGKARPESDIDLLIVKKSVPPRRFDRTKVWIRLAERISEDFRCRLSAILLDPEMAKITKPYYLDMIEAVAILYDRDGFFQGVLDRLRERMRELGTRRVWDEDGNPYWILKPGSKPGEEIVL